ncbi:hypothetical protein SAMN05421770_101869 [Granulicella rosea]|uniref:Uncharacterized protein n=1 Tax=Granulicella rosea TaxID=474952 RepID=A0A239EBV7_9BACT|nr:hypothetical protein SAMN05421770_101869 [Granulicella rosea]
MKWATIQAACLGIQVSAPFQNNTQNKTKKPAPNESLTMPQTDEISRWTTAPQHGQSSVVR